MITAKRGFAAMTPERRREIASMGGKKSPANFKYNKSNASRAGAKGGKANRKQKNG